MKAEFSDFYHWLRSALGFVFGRCGALRWFTRQNTAIVKMSADGRLSLFRPNGKTSDGPSSFDLADLGDHLKAFSRINQDFAGKVVLKLDPKHYILRKISALSLPASQLAKAARLDFHTSTPFNEDEFVALGLVPDESGSHYAIVRKTLLEQFAERLVSRKCELVGIEFGLENSSGVVARHSLRGMAAMRPNALSRIRQSAVAGLAILSLVTVAHASYRNRVALAEIEAASAVLAVEAKVTREALNRREKAIAEIQALRKNFDEAVPVSVLWEELAKVLPDTAFLTDFEFKENQAMISGIAAEAAAVIIAIEKSPRFENASFFAPAVRAVGQEGERFQVTFSVEGGQ